MPLGTTGIGTVFGNEESRRIHAKGMENLSETGSAVGDKGQTQAI